MNIFRVSFIGHRVVDEYWQVEEELDEVIELLHRKYGFIDYNVGRNGEFDDLATQAVRRFRREWAEWCELTLVEPYPVANLDIIGKSYDSKQLFDKPQLQKLQTDFYEEVGKKYGLRRGKEGSQRKHLSTAEFKAKKIIEQAEAIRQENQVYADALEEAKSGEIPRKRGRLQEQVIALTAENKDLTAQLDKSMGETLEYAKKAEALERQKDSDSHYARVGKTIAKSNPKEYERIIYGKPKTIGHFFDSLLSLFTPEVTKQIPRLQQIEAELEEERQKQEQQRKNNNYK